MNRPAEPIERMARAIWEAEPVDHSSAFEDLLSVEQEDFRRMARAAIAALRFGKPCRRCDGEGQNDIDRAPPVKPELCHRCGGTGRETG